jgi:hypothetical protein
VGHRTKEAKVINLCKLFGSAETPIQDLTTSDGTSIWAGAGVHLTQPAYRVAARLLMAKLERADHGEAGEPAVKRARLESFVPAPAPPPAKPTPKPVEPTLWLSRQLPPRATYNNQGSGQGGNYGWMRGGGRGKN